MRSKRWKQNGFTLLESLIASAIIAIFALPIISALSKAAAQDSQRVAQFAMHEFAVSFLEERVGTRNFSPEQGVYENQITYQVLIAPYQTDTTDTKTRFNDLIDFIEITIRASIVGTSYDPVEVSQVIARKAQR